MAKFIRGTLTPGIEADAATPRSEHINAGSILLTGVTYPAITTGAKSVRGIAKADSYAVLGLLKQSYHYLGASVLVKPKTTFVELHSVNVRLSATASANSRAPRAVIPTLGNGPRTIPSANLVSTGVGLSTYKNLTILANPLHDSMHVTFAAVFSLDGSTTAAGLIIARYAYATDTFEVLAQWGVSTTIGSTTLTSADLPMAASGTFCSTYDKQYSFSNYSTKYVVTVRDDSATVRAFIFSYDTLDQIPRAAYLTQSVTTYPFAADTNIIPVLGVFTAPLVYLVYTSSFTQSGKTYITPHYVTYDISTGAVSSPVRMLGNGWGTVYRTMYLMGAATISSDLKPFLHMVISDGTNYLFTEAWVDFAGATKMQATLPTLTVAVDSAAYGAFHRAGQRKYGQYVGITAFVDDTYFYGFNMRRHLAGSATNQYRRMDAVANNGEAVPLTSLTGDIVTDGNVSQTSYFSVTATYANYGGTDAVRRLACTTDTSYYRISSYETSQTGTVANPGGYSMYAGESFRFTAPGTQKAAYQDGSTDIFAVTNQWNVNGLPGVRIHRISFQSTVTIYAVELEASRSGNAMGSLDLLVQTIAQERLLDGLLTGTSSATLDILKGLNHLLDAQLVGSSTATIAELRVGGVTLQATGNANSTGTLDLRAGKTYLDGTLVCKAQVVGTVNAYGVRTLAASVLSAAAAEVGLRSLPRLAASVQATAYASLSIDGVCILAGTMQSVSQAAAGVYRPAVLSGVALSQALCTAQLRTLDVEAIVDRKRQIFTNPVEEALWATQTHNSLTITK